MEYFLVETDKKNRITYGINVNRAVDIRFGLEECLTDET